MSIARKISLALVGLSALGARAVAQQPALPNVTVDTGNATTPQLLRVSLPCPPGALTKGQGVVAVVDGKEISADVHPLTHYPGEAASARRAIVTLPLDPGASPTRQLAFRAVPAAEETGHIEIKPLSGSATVSWDSYAIEVSASSIEYRAGDKVIRLEPTGLAPLPENRQASVVSSEDGRYYAALTLRAGAEDCARQIDVKSDCLGTVAVSMSIQRTEKGDGYAPAFGWKVIGLDADAPREATAAEVASHDGAYVLSLPTRVSDGRGSLQRQDDGALLYLRCAAEDKVPWQEAAWRRASVVLGKPGHTPMNALLLPVLNTTIAPEAYVPLYDIQPAVDLSAWPLLQSLHDYTAAAIAKSAAVGDDAGDVTSFNPGSEHGGAFGMNRLNHAPPMYFWDWAHGGSALRDTATNWCLNNYDLSIWWGAEKGHGGTRYNNAVAAGQKEHEGDQSYMWRLNQASNFCTKGFDTFFYAYEETGDPRFEETLAAQLAYAKTDIHTNTGEARNIGDVRDFLHLYRATGKQMFLDEALRLFRELVPLLSAGDLFSQGGQPIEADLPFINDDAMGTKHPFAKPYIIGYALAGLPDLLRIVPDEPKLRDVVRAVADFLAATVDPAGGWRYPHPRSAALLISQGIEHANQICNAAAVLEERGEPIENLLDAVETVLQARVLGYAQTGAILAGLSGWEQQTGAIPAGKTLYDLYQKPEDRDPTRDYTEGAVGVGGSPPEGLVYLDNVLRFYLAHRPAERLFHANPQLQQVLDRCPKNPPAIPEQPKPAVLSYGMKKGRPSFADAAMARMKFPLAFENAGLDFAAWRKTAREHYLAALQAAPPRMAFDAEVIATEDRGTYEARKLQLNLSADYRVNAYLLVPKHDAGKRLPAVLALHDHGAHFSIGKEKVIRPFGVDPAVMQDAQDWVNASYGGRWFGDELARRGYVVFSTDAIFWGERGRAEGVEHKAQETLAANLIQLGMCFAGSIVWDDIRSAEFVQSLPEVDPTRIGAMGLSMGAHRTWNLAAATDIVKAGAAICWLGDTQALMGEGNNQTTGQSSHSMIFPGLRNELDYPDVASIACPKPMLFYNGERDGLFPVEGVKRSFEKIRKVYESQHAADKLETRLWDVPHEFNVEMQEAAFTWLDGALK